MSNQITSATHEARETFASERQHLLALINDLTGLVAGLQATNTTTWKDAANLVDIEDALERAIGAAESALVLQQQPRG